jgi:hypothetical protein
MFSKASRLGPRRVGVTLGGLAIVAALALPGSAWADQNETSTKTINGTATQIIGDATGGGVAGAAVAINAPIVIQQNIQVDTTGNTNNNQTATNTATVNQDTAAGSGDAAGSDGGTATSGAAVATSTAVILQLNIQIITGFVPTAGVSQTASNDATVDQTTVAGSGGADATGSGSTASSGTATANNSAYVGQINVQLYNGSYGSTDTTGAAAQTATTGASAGQTTVGASGMATASDGGQSTTGNAAAQAQDTINQLTWQWHY